MKRATITLTVIIALLSSVASATAQNATATSPPDDVNIAGTITGAAVAMVFFVFIAYAGYKVIKKWGSSSKGESD